MRGGVPWVWRRRLSVGVLAYLESRVRQRFRINNLVLLCAALCLCLAKCGTGEGGGVDNNGSLDATTADTTQSDTAPIAPGPTNCDCTDNTDCTDGFCKGGQCQPPLENNECWGNDGICHEMGHHCVGGYTCSCESQCALETQPGTCVYSAPIYEVLLTLTNGSDSTIFVQTINGLGSPDWHEVYIGSNEALRLHETCDVANCDDPFDSGSCGSVTPSTQQLASGESIEWIWPSNVWSHAVGPNGVCEYGGAGYVSGGQATARFCWGESETNGFVHDPTCVDVPFLDLDAMAVSHTVE